MAVFCRPFFLFAGESNYDINCRVSFCLTVFVFLKHNAIDFWATVFLRDATVIREITAGEAEVAELSNPYFS